MRLKETSNIIIIMKKPQNKLKLNNTLKTVASKENATLEEVHQEIKLSIAEAYNADNILIRSISKDDKIPTVEEVMAYILEHF